MPRAVLGVRRDDALSSVRAFCYFSSGLFRRTNGSSAYPHSDLVFDQTRKGGFHFRNIEEAVLDKRERDSSTEMGAHADGAGGSSLFQNK